MGYSLPKVQMPKHPALWGAGRQPSPDNMQQCFSVVFFSQYSVVSVCCDFTSYLRHQTKGRQLITTVVLQSCRVWKRFLAMFTTVLQTPMTAELCASPMGGTG